MSSPTQHAIKDIWLTLTHASSCDEVWWLLEGAHPERKTIVDACNRHLDFFIAPRPSMLVTFVILFSSLFDGREDCITLKSVPALQSDPAFDALWAKGRRLYRYRSKSIAHRHVRNDTVDFAKATGFSHDELRTLLQDVCALSDRYAKAQGEATVAEHRLSSADSLLEILRTLVA